MNIIFFLADIQDIWLFNYFLKPGHKLICAKGSKVTSPHRFKEKLEKRTDAKVKKMGAAYKGLVKKMAKVVKKKHNEKMKEYSSI